MIQSTISYGNTQLASLVRGGHLPRLNEIAEAVDVDVYRSLGIKDVMKNPRLLGETQGPFDQQYFDSLGDVVRQNGESTSFVSDDLAVVARGHMRQLGELTTQDLPLALETLGKEEYKKRRKGWTFKRFPVVSRTGVGLLGGGALASLASGLLLNFRYSTHTSYPVSTFVEGAVRSFRDTPDGQSMYLWKESPLLQGVFSVTKSVDEFVLNDPVVSHLGATWPYLVGAAVIGAGVGYVRGRTRKKIAHAQLKYELFSEDRNQMTETFVHDLTTPGEIGRKAANYRSYATSSQK